MGPAADQRRERTLRGTAKVSINAVAIDPMRPHLFATGSSDPLGESSASLFAVAACLHMLSHTPVNAFHTLFVSHVALKADCNPANPSGNQPSDAAQPIICAVFMHLRLMPRSGQAVNFKFK